MGFLSAMPKAKRGEWEFLRSYPMLPLGVAYKMSGAPGVLLAGA